MRARHSDVRRVRRETETGERAHCSAGRDSTQLIYHDEPREGH